MQNESMYKKIVEAKKFSSLSILTKFHYFYTLFRITLSLTHTHALLFCPRSLYRLRIAHNPCCTYTHASFSFMYKRNYKKMALDTNHIAAIVKFIRSRVPSAYRNPDIAIVCGSGLSGG